MLHASRFTLHAAFFSFAHLARCAAAILRRADADIVRTGVSLGADFTLAHRALCAAAIRRRETAETLRLPPLPPLPPVLGRPAVRVLPSMDSKAAIA